jgi:hypothetical protein
VKVVAVTLAQARRFVAEHHRHNLPPQGHRASVGMEHEGELIGVAIVGRPVARHSDDGKTAEILRTCVRAGAPPHACSAVLAAGRRLAAALGYERVITYTLTTESGSSPRAAGFRIASTVAGRATWDCPSRPRVQVDLFGNERRPPGDKHQWVWP